MNLEQKDFLSKLQEYVDSGKVIKKTNDYGESIFNYSREVQFNDEWDDVLIYCRGLILDKDNKVIGRPFKKFFNVEENKHTPTSSFYIQDKLDGSLGIIYKSASVFKCATRGSFHSEQAIEANKMLNEFYGDWLKSGFTYLVEIIYPENRIVVDYAKERKLVLLGVINNETGEEVDIYSLDCPLEKVQLFKCDNWSKLRELYHRDNAEGFIVTFSNGDKVKLKYKDYVDLHRIVTNISVKSLITTYFTTNNFTDILEILPDEFYNNLNKLIDELTSIITEFTNLAIDWSSKERIEIVNSNDLTKEQKSFIFAYIDGKKNIQNRILMNYSIDKFKEFIL